MATPIATALGRLGLTPNALTVIGFLGACVAAIAAAYGWWLAAGVLVLGFGVFDLFDGTLARATGRATKFGALLDSTLDRAGEAVVYIGIAVGCLAAGFALGAILSAAALAAAQMVSYVRAKAESLGYSPGSGMMNVGLAPREIRVILLVLGLVATEYRGGLSIVYDRGFGGYQGGYAPFGDNDGSGALAVTLALITILATVTVIQRVLHVRSQAKEG